jgi:hypothetical protein
MITLIDDDTAHFSVYSIIPLIEESGRSYSQKAIEFQKQNHQFKIFTTS